MLEEFITLHAKQDSLVWFVQTRLHPREDRDHPWVRFWSKKQLRMLRKGQTHPVYLSVQVYDQAQKRPWSEKSIARGKARRLHELKGKDSLFEYACSDESIIGKRAEQLDIKVVRLTKSLLDKPLDNSSRCQARMSTSHWHAHTIRHSSIWMLQFMGTNIGRN